ncbi:MAG TPA: hypothetical protein VL588_11565 [Bdellovibrionota bacterium]|nr:hypothetical protein [Bdellovibrionota bacterium]
MIKKLVLLAGAALSGPALASPHLNWGPRSFDALKAVVTARERSDLQRQLRNTLHHAEEILKAGKAPPFVDKIEREGVLPSDPRYQASEAAIRGMEDLVSLALCSRIAPDAGLASRCLKMAQGTVIGWTHYRSEGNPINDGDLVHVILAADLILDALSPGDQATVLRWLTSLRDASDRHFMAASKTSSTRVNNHHTWGLAIRALAGKLLANPNLSRGDSVLLTGQAQANLEPPPGWKPDPSCANNAGEPAYGGYDFRQRDALHYAVYNLKAWAWVATFAPDLLTPPVRADLAANLQFLGPYFTGKKTHREFVCSTVPFDIERRKAGVPEFQNENWKPERLAKTLRMILPLFPEIRPWAGVVETVDGERFSANTKAIAALMRP